MIQLLTEYRARVANAQSLISLAHITDINGAFAWPADAREMVVETVFLKIFISWEWLLEQAFLEFLLGNPSAAGNVIARYASPLTRDHASRMLIGNLRYVDWTTPDAVRKLSQIYFPSGDPFETVLSSIHSDLLDFKTIRNAAAHLSSTTSSQLDALASRKLQKPVSGVSPSFLLLSVDPASSTGDTILNECISVLDAAADRLVHA